MADKEIRKTIVKALRDENPNIRRGAAIAAGVEGFPEAGPGLVALLKDPQWQVRQAAAYALGQLKESRAVPFLRKVIGADESNERVRIITVLSQKAKNAAEAREAMIRIWGEDFKEREVHLPVLKAAAWALGHIERKRIIDPLIEIIKNGNENHIIPALSGITVLQVKDAEEVVIPCLKHEPWRIRQTAAITLGKIGSERAVLPLMEAYGDARWEVRLEAVIALNNLKVEESKELFVRALEDERADVRRAAAIALGNTRDEKVADALKKVLSDKSWIVRKAVFAALGNLRLKTLKDEALQGMLDEDEEVRQEAALAYVRCVPIKL